MTETKISVYYKEITHLTQITISYCAVTAISHSAQIALLKWLHAICTDVPLKLIQI